MTARIFIHPKGSERLSAMARRMESFGYGLNNWRRGFIEARPLPRRRSVVDQIFQFAKRPQ